MCLPAGCRQPGPRLKKEVAATTMYTSFFRGALIGGALKKNIARSQKVESLQLTDERRSLYSLPRMAEAIDIAPARGRLGVLLVGLGAVSTTTIAGALAVRKGFARPIGSLTQMGTVRLGKRTEGRSPKISEVVPLASLDDIVFGGWDIFEEDCYTAAKTAGVLEPSLLDKVRGDL